MAPLPTIRRIETVLVDIPTLRAHRLATGTVQSQTSVLVQVHASDGILGLGEVATVGGPAYGDDSAETIQLMIQATLASALLGQPARAINRARLTMDHAARTARAAKAAVEMALWDGEARRQGLAVVDLLGGPAHDQGLEVAWTLATGDPDQDIAEAEQMLTARRHRRFKIKIGAQRAAEDVARVTAIARALAGRAEVRVDVNQAWDPVTALTAAQALADAGVTLIEQPLPAALPEAAARLRQHRAVALLADEAVATPEDVVALARLGAADAVSLKLAKSGGLIATGQVAATAMAHGLGLYGGTMLEGTIGTAAAAHLLLTLPPLRWGTELFAPLLLTDRITQEAVEVVDFHLRLPPGPGFGLSLDADRLARYRRDRVPSVAVSAVA